MDNRQLRQSHSPSLFFTEASHVAAHAGGTDEEEASSSCVTWNSSTMHGVDILVFPFNNVRQCSSGTYGVGARWSTHSVKTRTTVVCGLKERDKSALGTGRGTRGGAGEGPLPERVGVTWERTTASGRVREGRPRCQTPSESPGETRWGQRTAEVQAVPESTSMAATVD